MVALQLRTAGSNVVFAAVTEISDSVLKGAETSGFDGLVQFKLLNLFCANYFITTIIFFYFYFYY